MPTSSFHQKGLIWPALGFMKRIISHRSSMLTTGAVFMIALLLEGCGGGGGTAGGPAPVIDFSKKRAGLGATDPAGQPIDPLDIVPIHVDRATAEPSTANSNDFDFQEVDSPCMVDDPGRPLAPLPATTNDRYMLFYEATDGFLENSIGLITSNDYDFDEIILQRLQVLQAAGLPSVEFSGTLEDAISVTDPTVVVDKSVPFGSPTRYRMWVEGVYGLNLSAFLTCTSGDGESWTVPELCTGFELGPQFGTVSQVVDPDVVLVQEIGETYRMVFEVIRTDQSAVLGMATSLDGVNWTVTDGTFIETNAGPVFSGGPGAFDDGAVRSPGLGIERDPITDAILEWHLFYEGQPSDFLSNNDSLIGYSNSVNGFSWSGYAVPVITPTSDILQPSAFDTDDVKHPYIFVRTPDPITDPLPDLNKLILYYSGDPEFSAGGTDVNRIGVATAE